MARCRLVADSRRAVAGPHPTLLRTGFPPIALLLCAAVLPGQSADVLSKHNAAFLNGLWQAGYVEYADKIGDLVAASNLSDAEKKAFSDRTALGRWGDPKELVGPTLMLASDEGAYVTGQTIVVDGGYLVR